MSMITVVTVIDLPAGMYLSGTLAAQSGTMTTATYWPLGDTVKPSMLHASTVLLG